METQKSFDDVRTMREIHKELTREFDGMSFEEQQRYIRERVRIKPADTAAKSDQDAA